MIIILMGVSGSGKTTIGKLLAESLNWEFYDGDAFHSPENLENMLLGIPLNDVDRMPWLQDLQTNIKIWLQENKNVVLACSALKASYRQILLCDSRIQLVYCKGSFDIIQERLRQRQNHFMNEKLLKSQFDDLEEPDNAIYVDISQPNEVSVNKIRKALGIEAS
ncbi:gluconokinase [Anabaena cylindrica FACHB-243]|uniref:Gluconokinase n=1 Tax=Anabaena cylindrica (strain ATCC 27899 / PCC 7122) TaxID=272123 RepID=K9ZB64_ANACC|nr:MULTISPECIES: gluconokinase [Anabaena]AFZ56421.1 gluconate kinase, SKI family [Anabaena cylindrica PCC 7122]MBD2418128.1 gluconokinase [Anabaena cylindrica FACHB-243]MBY5281974.1 gluconokinase [Anabaena sp. CCAP 1446/1C]MBY5311371.1 gluconokinase [Anabaena sp. CCAP 1446/1C]MCM2407406.1 gluconokinase [Anabaena sp. CCAP 1446/1C]